MTVLDWVVRSMECRSRCSDLLCAAVTAVCSVLYHGFPARHIARIDNISSNAAICPFSPCTASWLLCWLERQAPR